MKCSRCHHANPGDAVFCEECGSRLEGACPGCGTANRLDVKFCTKCGQPVAVRPPAATAVKFPPPASYTPKHLAEKILTSKSALEGERKLVTVLFADLKGSMELLADRDPEEARNILDPVLERMMEAVHRYEGTVNQVMGDGIMALFGAPLAHEDHAVRACYAALRMQESVKQYADEVRRSHGVVVNIRVGVNSGEVVVRSIGSDLRMDYTAVGQTTHLAARMEQMAMPGSVLLTADALRLAEGFVEVKPLGPVNVKGLSESVEVFGLEAVGAFRTRFDRSRARGLSAFVGRDREMAALDAALERARGGGQVVGVVAEAGTGKSRLCAEFVESCRARGIPILEGRGVAHGKTIPMLPMLEMWRAFYEIGDGDGPETTRAKIADRLLLMDESFREVLPFVFDLFGAPDPANPSPAIDPEQRQKRIHGVLKRILHDPAYGGLRVILLEDLHWFDGASDTYLETTVDSVPATRDLLLVTSRPEYQAPWMQRPYYQQLSLQPLNPEALRALLRDLLGEDPSVAALPEIIHARTKGNPFFIEEVVQSLVEGGQLAGGRGAYQLATPVEALQVPASVQAVLSSRIDRLPELEKQLLQTAAVIGKTFSEALLGRVMASLTAIDDTAALDPALSALVTAEFLYEAALYPLLEYSFKHPLTQEVAQRSQLRERRVRVHAAVAQALTEAGGNLDERAAEIARHWDEAGAASKAARWHRHAAQWAGLSDPRESLRHWRRVRELVPGVEDASERSNLAVHACDQILSLGWRMGGSEEEAATAFAEGRALVESLGDRAALALLVGRYGLMRFSVAGSASDYARYGEEAALLARDCGDPKLRAAIGTLPAYGHFHAGEGRAALEWTARVLDEVGSDNVLGKEFVGYSPRAGALHVRAQALMFLGRLTEAWNQVRAAQRVAEESRELEVFTWMQVTRALLEYTCGRTESGLEHGRRSLDIAEKLDNEASRMAAYAALGLANLVEGQPAAARDAFRESATIARDRRVVRALLPLVLAGLAEAHLALGEPTEAVATAREGIDLGSAGGCLYNEALAQLALAAALLATDCVVSRAEIESALERAEHLVASIEGRALSPRILELRGRLAAAVGDAPSSDRTFREALDLYRAIGATGHAERLARELDA